MGTRRATGRGRRRGRLADALAELRRSEATQRACLDALEQGVVLSTLQGEVLVMNDAAERILGYSAADVAGRYMEGRFTTSVVGVTRLAASQLMVLLEATAVD